MGLNARKPVFGGGGGWRGGGGETTKRICAVWTAPLLITFSKEAYLNLWNFNFLASLWSWADWFECRFVRTPEDKFSCDEAHMFWVLKRTILSSRWFFSVSTMYVLVEKYENLILTTHSYHPWVKINNIFQRKIANIFLPISLSILYGCSKELSHWDGSFEYTQHMFWLRNKKIIFLLRTLN